MNIADPKHLEQLRNLPSGYLLDLLAMDDEIDEESIYWVLQERGMQRQTIAHKCQKRRKSNRPKKHTLWTIGRWLTIFTALIASHFNAIGLFQLFQSSHPFKEAFLFLATGCIMAGFFVGYKLTTCLYLGGRSMIYCGFPLPVGFVCLETGTELAQDNKITLLRMGLNALVGVNLTLFPMVSIYIMLR